MSLKLNVQFFHADQQKAALGLAQRFAIGGKTTLIGDDVYQAHIADHAQALTLDGMLVTLNEGYKRSGQPKIILQVLDH